MSTDGGKERRSLFGTFYFSYYKSLFAIATILLVWKGYWVFAAFTAFMTAVVSLLARAGDIYGKATFANAVRLVARWRRARS